MADHTLTDLEKDPVYLVRTAGRLAQMLLEIRDEYILDPRDDTLDQFERRLEELARLRDDLHELRSSLMASDAEVD